ncbi:hypothetical protein AB1N83_009177 [Pleurotus pulmonarius]
MLLISAPYQTSHLRPRPRSLALTMPFFEENNTTKNTTISDSNNTTTETTTNSHNDHSRSFLRGPSKQSRGRRK